MRAFTTVAVALIMVAAALAPFGALGGSQASGVSLSLPSGGSGAVHLLRPASATSSATVEVFLNATQGIAWDPTVVGVPSGASVIFSLGDIGTLPHNFTLDSISNDSNLVTTMTPEQVDAYFHAHPPLVKTPLLNTSGGPRWVTPPVKMAADGIFTYICEFPGHFQSGMLGHLYVGLSPPSTGGGFSLNLLQLDFILVSTGIAVVALFVLLSGRLKTASGT